MQRVLIIGRVSGALRRGAPAECKIISVSPAVSEILTEAGVAHASVLEYWQAPESWDEIHRMIAPLLAAGGEAPPAPWWDDWSHLIVDEARVDFFWWQEALRIVEVERPSAALVQEVDETHASYRTLRAIARAFELLGVPTESWE
jgi:hypothetical protein